MNGRRVPTQLILATGCLFLLLPRALHSGSQQTDNYNCLQLVILNWAVITWPMYDDSFFGQIWGNGSQSVTKCYFG